MIGLVPSQAGSRAVPLHAHPGARFNGRVPLQFRLLHVVGFLLTLPVVAATRAVSEHSQEHRDESVFAETNRTVLTVLGIAFMS